jgi:hypothetical protein
VSKESPDPATAVSAVLKLVQLLDPLSPSDRQRAISAAMILLGEPAASQVGVHKGVASHESQLPSDGIHPKAAQWMSTNGIARAQLEHVFSIETNSIDVIAAKLPGKSKRQQTVNAYLLCGLKFFLGTADTAFVDKDAREICSKIGCYDSANHSNYMKAFGNLITGTKESGWKITNPGLVQAAKVVKESTGDTHA